MSQQETNDFFLFFSYWKNRRKPIEKMKKEKEKNAENKFKIYKTVVRQIIISGAELAYKFQKLDSN